MLTLGRHQCLCGSRAKTAVVRNAEEPLQHNRSCAVSSSLTTLLDGRQDKLVVGGAGIHAGLDAKPCSLASARVCVDNGGLVVPVDADRAKALCGRDDTEGNGVYAPVPRAPVGRNAVEVAACPAAAHFRVCVVLHAPVARRNLDGLA